MFAPFGQKTRPLQIIHLHKNRIFKRLKSHTQQTKAVKKRIRQKQRLTDSKTVAKYFS